MRDLPHGQAAWLPSSVGLISLLAACPVFSSAAPPVAEVRVIDGAPTLLIDGQPAPPLLFYTSPPSAPLKVQDGRLELERVQGEALLPATVPPGSPLVVEASVTMQEVFMDDATASLRVSFDEKRRTGYLFGLQYLKGGNRLKLWKYNAAGKWETWHSKPLDWRLGGEVRLRLEVTGGHFAAFVDGRLVAEEDDSDPLPPGDVALAAYCCKAAFGDVSLQVGGKEVLRGFGKTPGRVSAPWRSGSSAERMRSFGDRGVKLFTYNVSMGTWWRAPGKYDFAGVEEGLTSMTAAVPGALGLLRILLNPPTWWLEQHPEEQTRLRTRDGREFTAAWASMGSVLWRQEAGKALAALVSHLSSRPVTRSILGWHVSAGDCGEWSYLWGEGCGDYSPAQRAAFTRWLTAKYHDDAGLQKAWHQPTATLASVEVPPPGQRYKGALGGLQDPRQAADVIDYLHFHSQVCAEAICYFAQIAKAACGRQHLVGAFYGYWISPGWRPGSFHNSGHHDLAQVLACPDLDFVSDPYSYRDRAPGAGWVGQAPQAAITLAGKLHLCEDDTRTFLTADDAGHAYGRCPDRESTIGVLQRNWAGAVTGGGGVWWMEQGPGWFEDPALLDALGRLQAVHASLPPAARRSAAEIALVLDERSADYLAQSNQLTVPLLVDQAVGHLTHVGAPYDILLTSQLSTARDYKVYLLPQAWAPDPEARAQLQALRRTGRTIVWVHAPGLLTPDGPSAEAASELTGMSLALRQIGGPTFVSLLPQADGPLAALPGGYSYGTHSRLAPILEVVDPEARVWGLARCTSADVLDGVGWPLPCYQGAGLAEKTVDGARVVFSAAGPLPAPVLRELARSAGVHVYSEEGDYVAASESLLALHASFTGTHRIKLPRKAKVTDALTGTAVGTDLTEFTVPLNLGQTGIWTVE
jgi:hypothetical protein